jgi:hypothetical protein
MKSSTLINDFNDESSLMKAPSIIIETINDSRQNFIFQTAVHKPSLNDSMTATSCLALVVNVIKKFSLSFFHLSFLLIK